VTHSTTAELRLAIAAVRAADNRSRDDALSAVDLLSTELRGIAVSALCLRCASAGGVRLGARSAKRDEALENPAPFPERH
jgi:hypothetical protein